MSLFIFSGYSSYSLPRLGWRHIPHRGDALTRTETPCKAHVCRRPIISTTSHRNATTRPLQRAYTPPIYGYSRLGFTPTLTAYTPDGAAPHGQGYECTIMQRKPPTRAAEGARKPRLYAGAMVYLFCFISSFRITNGNTSTINNINYFHLLSFQILHQNI